MRALLVAASFLAAASTVDARSITISPTAPVALEFVHATVSLSSCERVAGVEPTEGGFQVLIDSELPGPRCDALGSRDLTLGAFPPGTYAITTIVRFPGRPPTIEDGSATITVSASVASTFPGDDLPRVDLSGIWTTPSEPYTGFAFIESETPPVNGFHSSTITGIWYDFRENGQQAWTLLLFDSTGGRIVRPLATGSGATRTIAQPVVGTATLAIAPNNGLRLRGTIDGRAFDLPLERFRWTRAAWPARAPTE